MKHASSTDNISSDQRNIARATVAATIGTVIEWFDYALYGAAAGLVINRLFFPELEPANGVLAAFATFAVGFFIRPVGGIVISGIGDRFGRKPALLLTILLMGAATVGMGMLPTFADVGILAPLLLIFLRLVQGFGAGAELAGAMVLLAEYALPRRRGLFTAIPNAATLLGIMLATLAFLFVSEMPDEVLFSWGWRLPFLLSAVLFLVALYIRHRLEETPEYVAAMSRTAELTREQTVPIKELLRTSPKEVVAGFLSVSGHNANAYILNTFLLSFMVNSLELPRSEALVAVLVSSGFGIVSTPFMGALSDRLGSWKVYIAGAAFMAAYAYPLFALISTKDLLTTTIAMSIASAIGLGCMAGGQGAFLANLFPTRVRFSGLALSRELNGLAIAGPTPYIATWLVERAGGSPVFVALYLMLCCAITVLAVIFGRRRSIHE